MTDTLEHTARRIAARGRDELLSRLRPAFEEAARAHSDVLPLDAEALESMVQRAADRADGLQWRRALAAVATEELGIGLGEALGHPAVARAQVIVGAPSYEDSLAALGSRPSGPGQEQPPGGDRKAPAGEVRAAPRAAARATRAAPEAAAPAPEAEPPSGAEEKPAPGAENGGAEDQLRLPAIHLGGIANLDPAEADIELRLSDDGLDIARGPEEILGRLRWPEISSLDVPPARGLRRRRRQHSAQLVIRTEHGEASFEIPDLSGEELRGRLRPLLARYGRD